MVFVGSRLQTLALPLGYAAIRLETGGLPNRLASTCYGHCYGLVVQSLELPAHMVVSETRVVLRHPRRAMPQEVLKDGQATTRFKVATSERVPQLVDAEPLHAFAGGVTDPIRCVNRDARDLRSAALCGPDVMCPHRP